MSAKTGTDEGPEMAQRLNMNLNPKDGTATQFKDALMALIYRYSQESDLTVYELVGALEVAKGAVLKLHQNGPND